MREAHPRANSQAWQNKRRFGRGSPVPGEEARSRARRGARCQCWHPPALLTLIRWKAYTFLHRRLHAGNAGCGCDFATVRRDVPPDSDMAPGLGRSQLAVLLLLSLAVRSACTALKDLQPTA